MEIVQWFFMWVVIGVWICYKRNWYKYLADYNDDSTPNFVCGCTIVFAPMSLILALFDVFCKKIMEKRLKNLVVRKKVLSLYR